jgi:hypothetical protein
MIDASPLLKDPIGQTIFDNIFLPMLISKGEVPESSTGAPLYPMNATTADKAFYIGRGLADQMVPSTAGVAGMVLPTSMAKYYPGEKVRAFSYAKPTGSTTYPSENKLGIPSTEASGSRQTRNRLGELGISVEPLNTAFAAQDAAAAGKTPAIP